MYYKDLYIEFCFITHRLFRFSYLISYNEQWNKAEIIHNEICPVLKWLNSFNPDGINYKYFKSFNTGLRNKVMLQMIYARDL